jgi:hypothetical protein
VADIVALRRRSQHGNHAAVPAGSAVRAGSVAGSAVPAGSVPAGSAVPLAGVRPASAVAAAGTGLDRLLPVLPELRPLLPGGGLRRGATVAVSTGASVGRPGPTPGRSDPLPGLTGIGATSLMLALLAGASRAGSWCAVVGLPTLGAVAAAEVGIDLGRLALVPDPGPDWSTVVAALLDGVDVVVAVCQVGLSVTVSRRLAARARQRGSVLVPYGTGWEGADLVLEPVHDGWQGLGAGRGRLRARELTVRARGRGVASRPRQVRVWLPTMSGGGQLTPVGSGPAGRPIHEAPTAEAAVPYPDEVAV